MSPITTAEASERGCGSWPLTVPATAPVAAGGVKLWTTGVVVGEPPPNTKSRAASSTPAASWTGEARLPSGLIAPLVVSSEKTLASEPPAASSPPATITEVPEPGKRTSRESGWSSAQGRTPASTAGMDAGFNLAACVGAAVFAVGVDDPPEKATIKPTTSAATPITAAIARRRRTRDEAGRR